MFHVFHFGTAAAGVIWLYYLTTVYAQQYLGTTRGRRYRVTHTLPASETDGCFSSTVNVDADAGDGYCIGNVPFMSWVMYAMMIFSEFLSFVVALLFNFSMWRSICRGARYMDDFELPTPREQWPMVDILLCVYVDPVTDSMQTLKNYLSLQYAPELLDIVVLDVGYYKSVWVAIDHLKVTMNSNVVRFVVICVATLRGSCTSVCRIRSFLLAVLSFFFSEGEAADGGGLQCSDDISWTHVSYGQTSADSSVL
ncbi:unnamed protein product [Hyaloperonospora brassicae]|uniref:Glycosyltransferase 2-like domain-containing protein n=1 Tax=Hyaloperonospora brassicae TaxID=162125 RepID=A0AAV0TNQ3_HYABA|nr:unnamed protein product [Hyaloperonospora brassicae]